MTNPSGLLLLSGGIDSPVAGSYVIRQGHPLAAIHFSQEPWTDSAPEEKSRRLARAIGVTELGVVPAGDAFAEMAKRCEHRYYFVLMKRFMMRVASEAAKARGDRFLVTGENLGQVSSQTLANLVVIQDAAALPVVRPLLALDKVETVREARAIDTFEISKGPEVCDILGPKHPATTSTLERILREESKIPLAEIARAALDASRWERLSGLLPLPSHGA